MSFPLNDSKDNYKSEVQEIWKKLANEMKWNYTQGPWFNSDIIEIKYNSWTIILDTYRDSFTGKGRFYNKFTRVRAPLININKFKFRFVIYKEDFISKVGKLLGMQDVEIGVPSVDKNYIFKSNDVKLFQNLFNNQDIRSIFETNSNINLELRLAEANWYNSNLPKDAYEIYFREPKFIKDTNYLKDIINLFKTLLDQLSKKGITINISNDVTRSNNSDTSQRVLLKPDRKK